MNDSTISEVQEKKLRHDTLIYIVQTLSQTLTFISTAGVLKDLFEIVNVLDNNKIGHIRSMLSAK